MKKLLIISLFFLLLVIFYGRIVSWVLVRQISHQLPMSQVKIGDMGTSTSFLFGCRMQDISLSRPGLYELKIKGVEAEYNAFTLLGGFNISRLVLAGLDLRIDAPGYSLANLSKLIKVSKGKAVSLERVVLVDAKMNVQTKDFSLRGGGSLDLSVADSRPHSIYFKVDEFSFKEAYARELTITMESAASRGAWNIKEAGYGKTRMDGCSGEIWFLNKNINLTVTRAMFWGGSLRADAKMLMPALTYDVALTAEGLKLAEMVKQLEIKDRLSLTGELSGNIAFAGESNKLTSVQGKLDTSNGGTMVITDDKFLRDFARSSGQALEIVVEGFRDYHYNIGTVNLGFDKGDVILNALMEGQQGRRSLVINLHDFKILN